MRAFPDIPEKEEDALKEEARHRSSSDLFYLAKHLLGYDRVTDHIHKQMARDVDTPHYKFKLLLWPRGHFKSTIATESGAILRLLRDANERILITNAKLGNSRKFLRAIANHFNANARFRWAWRDWWLREYASPFDRAEMGDRLDWVVQDTQDEFTLLRNRGREASISTAGVNASMVSQHYSAIIGDDMVNREYVSTPEMVEKSILHFKDLLDLLDPEGEMIIIGTRWSYMDLYGWIMEEFGHKAKLIVPDGYISQEVVKASESTPLKEKEWLMSIKPCYDEVGDPIFPEEFSRRKLLSLEQDKGPYEFGAQYLLNPVSTDQQKFKPEWFHTLDNITGIEDMDICLTVDPAKSLKDGADRTAMVVYGYDPQNRMYLLDGYNEQMAIDELPEALFELVQKWQHQGRRFYPVGFESVGFQETYIYTLNRMMAERKHYFTIEPIPHRKTSKEERILRLVPRIKNGFFMPRSLMITPFSGRGTPYDLSRRLLWELTQFPFGSHDDLADATADQLEIVRAGALPRERTEQKDSKVVDFVHQSVIDDRKWKQRRAMMMTSYNDAVR